MAILWKNLYKKDHKKIIDFNQGYTLECGYVKKFIKNNPDYIYVFSEDMGHIPEMNWIVSYVDELIEQGHKLIILEDDYCKVKNGKEDR